MDGCGLPVPLLISLLGPWGARMRRDLRRINVWTGYEVTWLRPWAGRPPGRRQVQPGQKLNAIFVGGSILVMLATGLMLKWFRFFPVVAHRRHFVHDVLASRSSPWCSVTSSSPSPTPSRSIPC